MMFDVAEGGIVEPISWDASHLQPNKSIIILDEENSRVWLWHGKARALVPRRMALRQAESMKGHGFQAGNTIIGRGLSSIIEIDDRKVGIDAETTKINEQLTGIIKRTYKQMGDFVYYVTGAAETVPSVPEKPKPAVVLTPTPVTQKPTHQIEEPKKKVELVKVPPPHSSELKPTVTIPTSLKAKEPEKKTISPDLRNDIKKALAVYAVMDQFKDIWASKKSDGSISMEQLDGKICSFTIERDELKFLEGSFTEAPPESKKDILNKYSKYLSLL